MRKMPITRIGVGRITVIAVIRSLQLQARGGYLGIVADWEPHAHNATQVSPRSSCTHCCRACSGPCGVGA
jgi:hypothetical protein